MTARRSPLLRVLLVALVAFVGLHGPVDALAQDPLQQVLDQLAARPERRASFVERQFSPLLNAPLQTSGRLYFRAPDRLDKETLVPRHEWLRIRGDVLTIEAAPVRGVAATRSVRLSEQPALGALVASLRATLAGDRSTLLLYYEVTLQGGPAAQWTLALTPKQGELRSMIEGIEMHGRGDQLEQVVVLTSAGDRSELSIKAAQ